MDNWQRLRWYVVCLRMEQVRRQWEQWDGVSSRSGFISMAQSNRRVLSGKVPCLQPPTSQLLLLHGHRKLRCCSYVLIGE